MSNQSPPNCSYEFYTVHTDSLSSNTWTNSGRQDSFVTHLFRPIENVVQVSVITANIPTENSNVCYLRVDELTSQFNESTGESTTNSITSSNSIKPCAKPIFFGPSHQNYHFTPAWEFP